MPLSVEQGIGRCCHCITTCLIPINFSPGCVGSTLLIIGPVREEAIDSEAADFGLPEPEKNNHHDLMQRSQDAVVDENNVLYDVT